MLNHASIYALGNLLRSLASFLMLPIYTNYLSPTDYGVVGLLIFVVSLVELLFGARTGLAIPKYYFEYQDAQARARVVSTALLITGVAAALSAAVMMAASRPLSLAVFGTPRYSFVVLLFATLVFTQGLEAYGLIFVRLQRRPWLFVSAGLFKLLMQLSLNVWFVVVKQMGVTGVAVSMMVSSLAFTTLLMIYTIHQVGLGFDRSIGRRLIRFSWPLWIGGFAGLYLGSSNRWFIRVYSGLEQVGLFELAIKFGTIITLLAWDPFSQYWQVESHRYYNRGEADGVFRSMFTLISALLVIAALGVSIFAGPVVLLMADEAFHDATRSVPYLAFTVVFTSLCAFSSFSFFVKEDTSWLSRNNYVTALLVTVLYLALIPRMGHVGASIALLVGRGIQFILLHRASRRWHDFKISLLPLAWILLVALIAGWMALGPMARSNFVADLLLKSGVYLLACVVIVLSAYQQPDVRKHLAGLWPRAQPQIDHLQ